MNYPINSQRLLDRFLRYVKVDTTADPDSASYPSSSGQLELGRLLVGELQAMGLSDAHQDEHGLVWALVPASIPEETPTILFNAHLDTSPEAPGANVRPQVIPSYAGGDISLPNGKDIRVEDCPALKDLTGHCLVTTSGDTLLGGDDKAGVACIMELTELLIENPLIPHGPVRVVFTCDEEIGLGAQHMDLDKADAYAGYTLDGGGNGYLESENFSADHITVQVEGYNIHPSIAKDQMVNATRVLSALINELPMERSPEETEDRQGFIHPYDIAGGVGNATCKLLLRDFETSNLDEYEALVSAKAKDIEAKFTGAKIHLERTRQYRNMADAIKSRPQVTNFAIQAFEDLAREHQLGAIRGGTDGAMFSEMGLPTPNLSSGQHNIHSVLEFASVTEMEWAIQHAIKTLEIWQANARS